MINSLQNVCVIAPHPDDETLAVGGTISKLVRKGVHVSVLVLSGHLPPLYSRESFETTKKEAEEAFRLLGVSHHQFTEIPATYIHTKPVSYVTGVIRDFLLLHSPELVFIPFPDRHIDHRVIFDASVVACRPTGSYYPQYIFSYETLSETHWNVPGIEPAFGPEIFVDISETISVKEQALSCYQSQISTSDSRSIDACRSLARFRGSQNGCCFAEAFKAVRLLF